MSANQETQRDRAIEIELGPWTDGIVNAKSGKSIPNSALLDALNVDIDDAGKVRTRVGSSVEMAFSGPTHSLFSPRSQDFMLLADGTNLKIITKTPAGAYSASVLDSGWTQSTRISYAEVNGEVFASNGFKKARIKSDGSLSYFSIERPASTPVATASSTGSLNEGKYKVAITYVSSTGEESAASDIVNCDVSSGGGIALTSIPNPATAFVSKVRIYVSEANGVMMYRHAEISTGVSAYTVMRSQTNGGVLRVSNLDEFPACKLICYYKGMMFGAIGNVLFFSEPFRFGLIDFRDNIVQFERDIKLIFPVQDGIYVCTDKTYFMSGSKPSEFQLVEILPYSAIPGTEFNHATENVGGWFSDQGQIIAGDGGQLKNVTIGKLAADKNTEGASIYIMRDGIESIVNTFKSGAESNTVRCYDYAEATIRRAS